MQIGQEERGCSKQDVEEESIGPPWLTLSISFLFSIIKDSKAPLLVTLFFLINLINYSEVDDSYTNRLDLCYTIKGRVRETRR